MPVQSVNVLFLVTCARGFVNLAGCVDDERDICIMAENSIKAATAVDVSNIVITTDGSTMTVNPAPPTPSPPMLAPRVYTFGIGKRRNV